MMHYRLFIPGFILALAVSLFSFSVQAQKGSGCPDDLVPKLSENRSWGYADLFGQWVIEPIYSKVSPFIEGKAIVQRGILMGVIDCQGNVILQCKYERLTNFRNGKAWALEKGLWGLVGAKGQIFQAAQFSEINPIINTEPELAWVKKNNMWGLFNEEKNTFICQPQFKVAQVMSANASLVQADKTFGVLNHVNCGYLLPMEITRVKKLAQHDIIFEQNGQWGVFNDIGKTIINPEFDTIFLKSDELLQVKKNGKFGLYGLRGKKLLPVEFEEIGSFNEGFYLVKQNGKYGYCNRLGKVYIKPMYDEARPFRNKQAVVKKGDKWGVIDYANKFVLKPEYDNISAGKGAFYAIREKDKTYLYNLSFKKISEEAFDSVYVDDTLYAVRVKKDGKFSYYNAPAKAYVTTEKFDKADPYIGGFAAVSKGGKKGMLDVNGKLILPCQYDEITTDMFQNKPVFRTVLNGKEGVHEVTGKMIVPNDYDQIVPALPNYLKVKKDGKYGIIRTSGAPVTAFTYDYISTKADHPKAPEWPAMAAVKGKYGLINEKGEEVFPFKGKEIRYLNLNRYAVKEGKTILVVTTTGQSIELKYDDMRPFGSNIAAVKDGNNWGYVSISGTEQIKPQFEDAKVFSNKLGAVKQKGKWGIIDIAGKFVIPAEYDDYKEEDDGTRKLYKGGKEYILLPDGTLR